LFIRKQKKYCFVFWNKEQQNNRPWRHVDITCLGANLELKMKKNKNLQKNLE